MISRRVGAGGGAAKKCFLTIHCCTCSFFLETKDAIKLLLSQQKKLMEREISSSNRNKGDVEQYLERVYPPVSRTAADAASSKMSAPATPSG
ncbi:hypothetical protein CSUI_002565 [Cystoisospora suis]|uniref:Uncharacterized protein n=1 Tax=Cystoisospora suis TaxID=483139 RepID=A0A2C6L8J9_9APIC|nr:hypothetical protein CSUI_002565 [Cystoisospora suis]